MPGKSVLIDLCDDDSPLPLPEPKRRRRRERPTHRMVLEEENSSGEEVIYCGGKRPRQSDCLRSDEALARRLQEEEHRAAASAAPHADLFDGYGLGGDRGGDADVGRWNWLSSSVSQRREPGTWFGSLLDGPHTDARSDFLAGGSSFADMVAQQRAGSAAVTRARLGLPTRAPTRAGHLAALSMMDRDFGEADYEMLLRLDEASGRERKKARSANGKLLDALPSHRVSKSVAEANPDHVCVICLENIRAQQVAMRLRCGHEYHRPCVLRWLKSCDTPSCPQCKAPALGAADDDPEAQPCEWKPVESKGSPKQEQWWHT